MRLPNFFIIGAPKSGTSSLYHYLCQHPEVYLSPVKEPCFMALEGRTPRFDWTPELAQGLKAMIVTSLDDYSRLFDEAGDCPVVGEASSWYLHSDQACERIRHYAPGARMVAILRDPAERAYSAFRMNRRLGAEPCERFEDALDDQSDRLHGWDWGTEYLTPGFYARHLSRYREEFESGRLRVFLSEDLRDDPAGVLRAIFELLEVDPTFRPDFSTQHNVSSTPRRGWLRRVRGTAPQDAAGIPEQKTRMRLQEVYRHDIGELQEMLGRDLSAWLR